MSTDAQEHDAAIWYSAKNTGTGALNAHARAIGLHYEGLAIVAFFVIFVISMVVVAAAAAVGIAASCRGIATVITISAATADGQHGQTQHNKQKAKFFHG